jgi:hypothetical protein
MPLSNMSSVVLLRSARPHSDLEPLFAGIIALLRCVRDSLAVTAQVRVCRLAVLPNRHSLLPVILHQTS